MLRVIRRPDTGKSSFVRPFDPATTMHRDCQCFWHDGQAPSRCPCRAALPTYAGLFTLIGSCVALAIELCKGTSPLL